MSDTSPYTCHRVGGPGEPVHYELRDTSGRVVCKCLCFAGDFFIVGPHGYSRPSAPLGVALSADQLEMMMRAVM